LQFDSFVGGIVTNYCRAHFSTDTNLWMSRLVPNAFALIVFKCFVFLRYLRETFIDMAFLIC
jgi:hypothetical protein